MDAGQIIASLEQLGGQPVDEESRLEIELWQRGRILGSVPPHAREEIRAMLEGYVLADADACVAAEPYSDDARAKQAIAHVSSRFLVRFDSEFDAALTAGAKTPEIVKSGVRYVSSVPPDSL